MESFLISTIIFYSILYIFNYSINNDGYIVDISMISIGIIIILIIINILKITYYLNFIGKFI